MLGVEIDMDHVAILQLRFLPYHCVARTTSEQCFSRPRGPYLCHGVLCEVQMNAVYLDWQNEEGRRDLSNVDMPENRRFL